MPEVTNRDDPKFVEYYQTLADIIGIFWQFHKRRIEMGNIPFAAKWNTRLGMHGKYDPQAEVSEYTDVGASRRHKVIEDFAYATRLTFEASWIQYLRELGYGFDISPLDNEVSFLDADGVRIPEEVLSLVDPYLNEIIDRAQLMGEELSEVSLIDKFSVQRIVDAGANTGARVTSQLVGLFGEDFEPASSLIISKVALDNVAFARKEIGLVMSKKPDVDNRSLDYSLLDDSKVGLNRNRLKEWGLGRVLGCPAGIPISEEAREFLRDKGVVVEATMLEEFAEVTSVQFDEAIGSWFRGLSPEYSREVIEAEDLRILSGEARRVAVEENTGRRMVERM